MPTLLLRLAGPMQSWGISSRFDDRDTALEPSKSGVLGLLCAALGIDREDWTSLEPMTQWAMGVRVQVPGVLRSDFHTAQLRKDTALGRRSYLADADFYVGLESADQAALERAHRALLKPHWTLSLGRKCFPPARPVYLKEGLSPLPLRPALEQVAPVDQELQLVLENPHSYSERWDVPAAAFAQRHYRPRRIEYVSLQPPAQ